MAKKLVITRRDWDEQPIEDFTLDRDGHFYRYLNAALVAQRGGYIDAKRYRNITYNAAFSPASVKNGSAVNNNGSYAVIDGLSQGNVFSRITVIKPDTISGSRTISCGLGSGAGASQFRQQGAELELLKSYIANVGSSSGANLQINKTSVVGVAYDGTTVRFYCDGKLVGTASNTQTFNVDGNFRIGANSAGDEAFSGSLGLMLDFSQALNINEMLALTANPYQVFQPKKRVYFIDGGGAAVDLAGDAESNSTATASITTLVKLASAAMQVSTANGSMTSGIPLSGNAASVSVASNQLSAQIRFNAAALVQALSTVALNAGINLNANTISNAAASGSLNTLIQAITIAAAQASASGSLSGGSNLTANAISEAAFDGDLTTLTQLVANAASVASANVSLTVQAGLETNALVQAIANANLSTSIKPAANAQANANGSSNLNAQILLNSSATVSAGASATFAPSASSLQGAAVSIVIAGGVLTTLINFDADALSQAIAAGGITTKVQLDVDALSQAMANPGLMTHVQLNTNAAVDSQASATFEPVNFPGYCFKSTVQELMQLSSYASKSIDMKSEVCCAC